MFQRSHLLLVLVTIAARAEPVSTAILAVALLKELPPPLTIIGASVILIGMRSRRGVAGLT